MKFWKRSMRFAAFFALILLCIGTSVAQASDYFYRFTPPPGTVTCNTSIGGQPSAIATNSTFAWNLPAGASINVYRILNDVTTFSTNLAIPAGTGGGTGTISLTGPSFPFSAGLRWDTIVGGQVIYRSITILSCPGLGVGTQTITNGVPTNSSSAIADGRINPENYAPVALYCDGSVLTTYAVDGAGQGTFAWKFNLSGPSDQPLPNQLGISLLRAPDVRYSVLAQQGDGKQYLFVFDGCPYPGATETYISDPATGQFVRTD